VVTLVDATLKHRVALSFFDTLYIYKSFIHQKLVAHTHKKTHTKTNLNKLN